MRARSPSPFLARPESDWLASNALAFAIPDAFPVSPGHTLVIPKRLVPTWFDATPEEQAAILALATEVKTLLDQRTPRPDGYNLGLNSGAAAGQTVFHLHLHVIPRYEGDVPDPRGGVRHVIPGKGNYLLDASQTAFVQGGSTDPLKSRLAPLWPLATDVSIIAAFVQASGLAQLEDPLLALLADSTKRVRLLTGDYLGITQRAALEQLLDWSALHPNLHARLVETATLPLSGRSFHPKSWRFESSESLAVAFVGSSNVSSSALGSGVEWNLQLTRATDPSAYAALTAAFDRWWHRARPLTAALVAAYVERVATGTAPRDRVEDEPEPLPHTPPPHELQEAALDALATTRAQGRSRSLVVLATGLGKTLVAALDTLALGAGTVPRTLFLAHREELLSQAAATFRSVFRDAGHDLQVGFFAGAAASLDGDLVLASVQKLSLAANLDKLAAARPFDHVIVDEVHHATAASYRKILDRLSPRSLLGLTATPERADGADVLGLFDDHVAYRADLGEGIARDLLVPFAYFGLKDAVDYSPANIPWRNHRFDPERLAAAVETEARMETLLSAWRAHPGSRTLVFCCSIRHALHARDWLRAHGVACEAVHGGPGSFDREDALARLREGRLDALCTVDLFNEGVDVPELDRVVMLRPTESTVLFLQQLGRGLRRAQGKERLTVLDFVGNHRVFLERVRLLLSLRDDAGTGGLRAFLDGGEPELPPGCSVELELTAKELLRQLLPSGRSEVERVFRELLAARGERPSAGELYRLGYKPGTVREAYGSWFGFVEEMSALSADEAAVLETARAWFEHLEVTSLEKSFKMVTLEALLETDALTLGLPLDELARRSHEVLVRSPELLRDIQGVAALPDPTRGDSKAWLNYWKRNPIHFWTAASTTRGGAANARRWFAVEDDRFVFKLQLPAARAATLAAMTRELVDLRLAQYRARRSDEAGPTAFVAKVTWNQRDPILKLPATGRPAGELDVRLPDGASWTFRMMAQFCNVARPVGTDRNQLPDLLRRWFGPAAGRPGTGFSVRFTRSPDGWWLEPREGQVVPLARRGSVVAYPDLRAAAGAAGPAREDAPDAELVRLPVSAKGRDLFAVRACGESMNGGKAPIRDGDWLVMRFARAEALGAVEGKVALVQLPGEHAGAAYQVKRIVRSGKGWVLRSDNADVADAKAPAGAVPIAVLVETVRPEQVGPEPGTEWGEEELAKAFGVEGVIPEVGRVGGHLFLRVEGKGKFVEYDRLKVAVSDRRPGETAFVLTRGGGERWGYLGVGRWEAGLGVWGTPELDFPTWRALGHGRTASRRMPPGVEDRARELVQHLLATIPPDRILDHGGRKFRLRGPSSSGGVRIDGGPDGFKERTVSLTDLASALAAREVAGASADEAAVNRLRYLSGTPKASTRWIDTGWALVLVANVRASRPS